MNTSNHSNHALRRSRQSLYQSNGTHPSPMSPRRVKAQYFFPPSDARTITDLETPEVNMSRSSTFTPPKDGHSVSRKEVRSLKLDDGHRSIPRPLQVQKVANREKSIYRDPPGSPNSPRNLRSELTPIFPPPGVVHVYDSSPSNYSAVTSPSVVARSPSVVVRSPSVLARSPPVPAPGSPTSSFYSMRASLLGIRTSQFEIMDIALVEMIPVQGELCDIKRNRTEMIPPPKDRPSFDVLEAQIGLDKTPPLMKLRFPKGTLPESPVTTPTKLALGPDFGQHSRPVSSDSAVKLEPAAKVEDELPHLDLPEDFADPLKMTIRVPRNRQSRQHRRTLRSSRTVSPSVIPSSSSSLNGKSDAIRIISTPTLVKEPDYLAPDFAMNPGKAPRPPTTNQKVSTTTVLPFPPIPGKTLREMVEVSRGNFLGTGMNLSDPLRSHPPNLEEVSLMTPKEIDDDHSQNQSHLSVKFISSARLESPTGASPDRNLPRQRIQQRPSFSSTESPSHSEGSLPQVQSVTVNGTTFSRQFYNHSNTGNVDVRASTQDPIPTSGTNRYTLTQHPATPRQRQQHRQRQKPSQHGLTRPRQPRSASATLETRQDKRFQSRRGTIKKSSLVPPPKFSSKNISPPVQAPLPRLTTDGQYSGTNKALPRLPCASNDSRPGKASSVKESTPGFFRRLLGHSHSAESPAGMRRSRSKVPDQYITPAPMFYIQHKNKSN